MHQSLNTDSSYNTWPAVSQTFVKSGVCMHAVSLSVIFKLKLYHPKYSTKRKPDTFVTIEIQFLIIYLAILVNKSYIIIVCYKVSLLKNIYTLANFNRRIFQNRQLIQEVYYEFP